MPQKAIDCVIMRGGTSKGLFIKKADLPESHDRERLSGILLSLMGSPDPMQIDGLGGAQSHTSKVMIIARSTNPECDLDYTFAQVGVTEAAVGYNSNCGNLTAAVGPYAIDEGMVTPNEPVSSLTLYNTNTRKKIVVDVPVMEGKALVDGDFSIAGVPGTGAEILLHFIDPAGAVTGELLPTGNPTDEIVVGPETIRCSIVDAGALDTFVLAQHIGLRGTETADEIGNNGILMAKIERLRQAVAEKLELIDTPDQPAGTIPGEVVIVSQRQGYEVPSDGFVSSDEIDLVARLITRQQKPHHAYPVTGALCTAAAARIRGTIVSDTQDVYRTNSTVRIGHPKGVIGVDVDMHATPHQVQVEKLTIGRTARRLMDGHAYYRSGDVK